MDAHHFGSHGRSIGNYSTSINITSCQRKKWTPTISHSKTITTRLQPALLLLNQEEVSHQAKGEGTQSDFGSHGNNLSNEKANTKAHSEDKIERLGDHLIREAVLLHGVKDEVVWLKTELNLLRSFLQDAEEKQNDNKTIQTWVSQIRDIAYDAEDVIDTFIVEAKRVGTSKTELVSNCMMKWSCVISTVYLHDAGEKIEALKVRILDLSRQREAYGIKNSSIGEAREGTSKKNTRLRQLRRTTSYAEEEHDVVGFEYDARLLEAKLIQGEPQRSVISIFGMGGLGKTTLARKLYNNDAIKSKFDQHAWVCASQEWTPRDILERIVKSFKNHSKTGMDIEKMNAEDLERYARELLEGRRYFVVIDDVWEIAVWETLRRAFPDNKNGSRIIITTRIEAVAEFSGQRTYVHKLPFLQPDESWELFCKKVFTSGETSFAGDMEQLGREMVAKCGGLPLAIVVLGGLLSTKELHEWPAVKDHIWRALKNNSLHISSLLTLSYNDLPSYLKPCFLYLSLFPEDFVFNKERLIRLWIAEGFISHGEEMLDLEEVAEEYVKELVGRSLIQVVKGNWRSKIATCRVHDLLRDLAVNKARELKFLHIYDENTNFTTMTTCRRRLAFHSEPKRRVSIDKSDYHVRTLSLHPFSISEEFLSKDQLTRFRLLTVLNLGILRFSSSGLNAIGKLIHLRHLRIGVREDLVLPKTFANLQALQTLDFSTSSSDRSFYYYVEIPKWISKLKCVRHILGSVLVSPKSLRKLTNIRTLKHIRVDKFHKEELGLRPIGELINLQVLDIRIYESGCAVSIEPLLNCGHLLDLRVDGNIESLPEEMHKSLPNLKRLCLWNSELKQDPIPILQMFPNLVFLELLHIGSSVRLEFTSQGFPQLQALIVAVFNQCRIIMGEGAMPKLRAIDIPSGCSLPERFSSLPRVPSLNWDWESELLELGLE